MAHAPNFQPAPTGAFTPAPTRESGFTSSPRRRPRGGGSGGGGGGSTPAPPEVLQSVASPEDLGQAPNQTKAPPEFLDAVRRSVLQGETAKLEREQAEARREELNRVASNKRVEEVLRISRGNPKREFTNKFDREVVRLDKESIGGQTLRDGSSIFFGRPNQTLASPTDLTPEPQKEKAQTGAISEKGLKDLVNFVSTEPDFNKVIKANDLRTKSLESAKFVAVKPFQLVSNAFRESGKELKGSKFKSLKIVGVGTGAIGELIPRTPAGLGLVAGTIKAVPLLAKPLRVGALGGFGVVGIKGAINSDLTPEQRVASGIIGTGAIAGLVAETPFIANRRFLRLQNKKITESVKALENSGKFSPRELKTIDEGLRAGVKLELPLRKVPDVPITKKVASIIPEELTIPQKEVFASVVFGKDTRIFGGQALIVRGLKKAGGDIDTALPNNLLRVAEVEGLLKIRSPRGTKVIKAGREAIGLEGDKAFDLKPLERLKEFPLTQRPIKSPEGVKFNRASEEFARNLEGTIELRKGGKDIVPAIKTGRGLIKQGIKQARVSIPVIKQLRLFKIRSQELKLIKLEKASKPLSKVFEVDIDLPDIRLGLQTDNPAVLLAVPKSKKAQIPLTRLKIDNKPLRSIKNVFRIDKPAKSLTNRNNINLNKIKIKPSSISSSRIKPLRLPTSRILPSILKPSRLAPSKLSPSRLAPSKISSSILKPSRLRPSRLTNSIISPSVLNPSRISSSTFTPNINIPKTPEKLLPPSINMEGTRGKKKRGSGIMDDLGLSETFVQRQLLLKLPKNLLKADLKQRGDIKIRI